MTVYDTTNGAIMPVTEAEFDSHPEYTPINRVQWRDAILNEPEPEPETDYALAAVKEWERGQL